MVVLFIQVFRGMGQMLINRNAVDSTFVKENCVFSTGFVNIGYGMRNNPNHAKFKAEEKDIVAKEVSKVVSEEEGVTLQYLGIKAGDTMKMDKADAAGNHWGISFEDFKKGLEPYSLDFVAKLSKGNRIITLIKIARL